MKILTYILLANIICYVSFAYETPEEKYEKAKQRGQGLSSGGQCSWFNDTSIFDDLLSGEVNLIESHLKYLALSFNINSNLCWFDKCFEREFVTTVSIQFAIDPFTQEIEVIGFDVHYHSQFTIREACVKHRLPDILTGAECYNPDSNCVQVSW